MQLLPLLPLIVSAPDIHRVTTVLKQQLLLGDSVGSEQREPFQSHSSVAKSRKDDRPDLRMALDEDVDLAGGMPGSLWQNL